MTYSGDTCFLVSRLKFNASVFNNTVKFINFKDASFKLSHFACGDIVVSYMSKRQEYHRDIDFKTDCA